MAVRGKGFAGLIALTVVGAALWFAPAAGATAAFSDVGANPPTPWVVVPSSASTTGLVFRDSSSGENGFPGEILSIDATLSCAVPTTNDTNPCTSPDPGVFTNPTAYGNNITNCNKLFLPTSTDPATGRVHFEAAGDPFLTALGQICTIHVYYDPAKMPVDADPATDGVQTYQQFHLVLKAGLSGTTTTTDMLTEVTVKPKATPTLSASFGSPTATPTDPFTFSAQIGGTLSGGNIGPTAMTVSFKVWGPDYPTCTGFPWGLSNLIPQTVTADGPVGSGPFSDFTIPHPPGVYRVVATFSGNTYNNPVTTDCTAPGNANTITVSDGTSGGGGGGTGGGGDTGTTGAGGAIPVGTGTSAPLKCKKKKGKKKGKKRALSAKKKKKKKCPKG